jgi:predicted AlkP superfamily pyrophosphatase or phosphodiesterase
MMRLIPILLLAVSFGTAAAPVRKPKLVLTITVDQFRYDYLTRYRSDYKGGLNRLLTQGAVYTDAHFQHFPTVTAVGHSVILSGAMPSVSGIVGNDWYDRAAGKHVTSVSDDAFKVLGGTGAGGASPNRLLVTTVGDELKTATGGKSRVFAISLKDRGAILPGGHAADAAYWYDSRSGNFVSSAFYFPDLPAWVKEFNSKAIEKYKGARWEGGTLPMDAKVTSALLATPFGNELLEAFAERLIEAEKLGRNTVPDLLSVSFSSNDYVGHSFGPDSAQVKAVCLETDQALEKLFRFLDASIGMSNVLAVMLADHGVATMPEVNAARRIPGGRIPARVIQNTVQAELVKKYGDGRWILSSSEHSLYLNQDLAREKKIERAALEETVRETVLGIPHVWRAYTRGQLLGGNIGPDSVSISVFNGFHAGRGADVYILLEPSWMFGSGDTTHGTAFNYDNHVPVIFMGPRVRPGIYDDRILVNDVAPTLANLLDIEMPSGSSGRVLKEIILRDTK